jgi:hypothetical protein
VPQAPTAFPFSAAEMNQLFGVSASGPVSETVHTPVTSEKKPFAYVPVLHPAPKFSVQKATFCPNPQKLSEINKVQNAVLMVNEGFTEDRRFLNAQSKF